MRKKLAGNLMLLLTALIWGVAFVAQSVSMDFIGPFTFNGIRSIIGGLSLLPVLAVLRRRGAPKPVGERRRMTLIGGVCCGLVLFAASSFQQFGLVEADPGKAGFITTLYIVIVPLAGLLFGRRVRPLVWVAVLLAAGGLYCLCVKASFEIGRGDLLVLCSAFLFSVHILVIDFFSPRVDGVLMSCVQFFVAGALGILCMFLFEAPKMDRILACWLPILYAGVLSTGVGYTLQIIAQKNTNPTVASLLMSLESVFAALAGWLLLGEVFTGRELAGMVLMMGAVILAQLPERGKARLPEQSEA